MKTNLIKTCHWEITKRCNLYCIHCISSVGNKRELNTKESLKAINNLKNIGCEELYITGGEPLVRKDIFEILKKAKEKQFKISLITNGLLINRNNINKIKLYIEELGISLDGASSQINDKIRGKGTFKKILKAIEIVKSYQIPLTIYVALNRINLEDLKNILNLVSNFKIKKVKINEVSLRGRAYKNRSLLEISRELRENFRNHILEILKNYFPKFKVEWNRKCEIDSKTIFLSPLGYIYPCIEIFQRKPTCHLGNIREFYPERFLRYKKIIFKGKKAKCLYEELRGSNFSILLNNPFIKKCYLEKKICRLKKLIH